MVRRHLFIFLVSIISNSNSDASAQRIGEDDTDEDEQEQLTEISPWIPITFITTIAVGLIIYCIVKRLRKQRETTHNDLNDG